MLQERVEEGTPKIRLVLSLCFRIQQNVKDMLSAEGVQPNIKTCHSILMAFKLHSQTQIPY